MASYKLKWKRSAIKELKRLPKGAIAKVLKAVEQLPVNPYPVGVRKLAGSEHSYRIREGDYRVVYSIGSSIPIIEILRVGHRKNVYDS